jgi:hypothetical protein
LGGDVFGKPLVNSRRRLANISCLFTVVIVQVIMDTPLLSGHSGGGIQDRNPLLLWEVFGKLRVLGQTEFLVSQFYLETTV